MDASEETIGKGNNYMPQDNMSAEKKDWASFKNDLYSRNDQKFYRKIMVKNIAGIIFFVLVFLGIGYLFFLRVQQLYATNREENKQAQHQPWIFISSNAPPIFDGNLFDTDEVNEYEQYVETHIWKPGEIEADNLPQGEWIAVLFPPQNAKWNSDIQAHMIKYNFWYAPINIAKYSDEETHTAFCYSMSILKRECTLDNFTHWQRVILAIQRSYRLILPAALWHKSDGRTIISYHEIDWAEFSNKWTRNEMPQTQKSK